MSRPLSVTVVICTHNRPMLLERCLQAVRRIEYPDLVLSVVDSAPDSHEARTLAARYGADYSLVPIRGLSRARNVGARAARSDIVAYLDDDMVPHIDWLAPLVAEFADQRVIAATGPVLPLTMAEASPNELQLTLETSSWGPDRFQVDRHSPEWFERANFGDVGDGNMALRREAFDRFSGFDEQLGRGVTITSGEEHYAYFTLIETGHRIAYAPQAIVFHPVSPATPEYSQHLIAQATAYAAFLMWRHPRYALRVTKFFAEGLLRKKRSWRKLGGPQQTSLAASLSLREVTGAFARGVFTWWRSVRG